MNQAVSHMYVSTNSIYYQLIAEAINFRAERQFLYTPSQMSSAIEEVFIENVLNSPV